MTIVKRGLGVREFTAERVIQAQEYARCSMQATRRFFVIVAVVTIEPTPVAVAEGCSSKSQRLVQIDG